MGKRSEFVGGVSLEKEVDLGIRGDHDITYLEDIKWMESKYKEMLKIRKSINLVSNESYLL